MTIALGGNLSPFFFQDEIKTVAFPFWPGTAKEILSSRKETPF